MRERMYFNKTVIIILYIVDVSESTFQNLHVYHDYIWLLNSQSLTNVYKL